MTRSHSPGRAMALFDKYGGISGLRSVIMDFYDRVLDSDIVGPFFEDVDMPRLIDHQTKFFAALMGGPVDFAEDRLARAHAHLKISSAQFEEVSSLLTDTLNEAGFTAADRTAVLEAVGARRSLIVS